MIICVLFILRVSLLESNHNATLANSVVKISIVLPIESFRTYTVHYAHTTYTIMIMKDFIFVTYGFSNKTFVSFLAVFINQK